MPGAAPDLGVEAGPTPGATAAPEPGGARSGGGPVVGDVAAGSGHGDESCTRAGARGGADAAGGPADGPAAPPGTTCVQSGSPSGPAAAVDGDAVAGWGVVGGGADGGGETRCVRVASAILGPHGGEPAAAVLSRRSSGRGGPAPSRDADPLRPCPFGGEFGELGELAAGGHAGPTNLVAGLGRCPLTRAGSVGRLGSPIDLSPDPPSEGSSGSTTTATSSGVSSREVSSRGTSPRLESFVPTPRTTCVTSASRAPSSVEPPAGAAGVGVEVRKVDSASSPEDLSQESPAAGSGREFGVESAGSQRLPSHPVSLGTANWGGCSRADGCQQVVWLPVMGPPEDRRRSAARGVGDVTAVSVASSEPLGG